MESNSNGEEVRSLLVTVNMLFICLKLIHPLFPTLSHGDFVTIIDLPEGEHQYKFMVDGEWKHDPSVVSSN